MYDMNDPKSVKTQINNKMTFNYSTPLLQPFEARLAQHETHYDCCPEPYHDITLYIKAHRRYRVDPDTGVLVWRPEPEEKTSGNNFYRFPWFVNH